MPLIIKTLGILLIAVGIFLFIKPDLLYGWVDNNVDSIGLYIAAIVFRLGLGVLLILSAKSSKYPNAFKILGGLAIVAAIVFILIGHARFIDFLSLFVPEFLPYSPVSALMGIGLGIFFIYAFPKNEPSVE